MEILTGRMIAIGQLLDDDHIIMKLILKDENPNLDGFQYTLLSQNNGFHPVKGDALQIHHIDF